jgi:hypothetical protein
MDRLIWTAWRAFWVGLGASAVLIGQTLLVTPSHNTKAGWANEATPDVMFGSVQTGADAVPEARPWSRRVARIRHQS